MSDERKKTLERALDTGAALAPLAKRAAGRALESSLPPEERKSLLAGGLLGTFLPGAGLFYAAPFKAAIILTAGVAVLFGALALLTAIPLIGWLFAWIKFLIVGIVALASGLLGLLYTHRYNKTGQRTMLSSGTSDKSLPI